MALTAKQIGETQKMMSDELTELQNLNKEVNNLKQLRTRLDVQLQENLAVKEEMDLNEDDTEVFKMVGGALIPQSMKEARDTANNRINFIKEELARHEATIQKFDQKAENLKESIQKYQMLLQQTTGQPPVMS